MRLGQADGLGVWHPTTAMLTAMAPRSLAAVVDKFNSSSSEAMRMGMVEVHKGGVGRVCAGMGWELQTQTR